MNKGIFGKIVLTAGITMILTGIGGLVYTGIEAHATNASAEENQVVKQLSKQAKQETTSTVSTQKKASSTSKEMNSNNVTKSSTQSSVAKMTTNTESEKVSKKAETTPKTEAAVKENKAKTQKVENKKAALQPDTIYVNNHAVPYKNGGESQGQANIDGNPNGVASTWGGAQVQSGTDNENTHFIAHNEGAFTCILPVLVGDAIVVTDGNAVPTTYIVNERHIVDTHGVDVSTGVDLWDKITGTQGGERITLQTCLSSTTRLILFANVAK